MVGASMISLEEDESNFEVLVWSKRNSYIGEGLYSGKNVGCGGVFNRVRVRDKERDGSS